MKRPKKSKQEYVYEVTSPMPYCEIYLVKATSKREARRLFDAGGPNRYTCIGEISSTRKTETPVRKATDEDD